MVKVIKEFTFDSAHQLIGHKGKCANLHGHTYKLHVCVEGVPNTHKGHTDESFVIDFGDLKQVVKELIVDKLDHAFIALGNEPVLETAKETGIKTAVLGFRTTCENMAQFVCWKLYQNNIPVSYVQIWETPTGSAIVDIDFLLANGGPVYNQYGNCEI